MAIYDGFEGIETEREQRDWRANPTILSGDLDDDGEHVAGDGTTILDGVTISGGYIDEEHYGDCAGMLIENNMMLSNVIFDQNDAIGNGGGLCNLGGRPILTNVTFSNNTAGCNGGGMYNFEGSPTLTNVTFAENRAGCSGGGMYSKTLENPSAPVQPADPTLTNVTFYSNGAGVGGGMYNGRGNPVLDNVTFSANSADHGGGLFNDSASSPMLTNVVFIGNTGRIAGGGMYNFASNPLLARVLFRGNTASLHESLGGGMYNDQSNPTLIKVTFWGNSARVAGGGMYNKDSNPHVTQAVFRGNAATHLEQGSGGGMYNSNSSPNLGNVTFSRNSAPIAGGEMYNENSSPTLNNVIVWGDDIFNLASAPLIAYSLIQDSGGSGSGWDAALGIDGGGNIDAKPLFVDAQNGNLQLKIDSPAIDAGSNSTVPAGIVTDLAGNPRFVDMLDVPDTGLGAPPIVDMGAYEAHIPWLFLSQIRK